MHLDYLVPSWFEIESRVTDEMGYQGRANFVATSMNLWPHWPSTYVGSGAVQSATRPSGEAGGILHQRFADLEIASILNELLKVVREMAMIVVGSTLTGGAIGAGIGAFGAGAGAIPGRRWRGDGPQGQRLDTWRIGACLHRRVLH